MQNKFFTAEKILPHVTRIAGMGGELIAQILSAAEWVRSPQKHLLLQPMTQDDYLRRYLAQAGFALYQQMRRALRAHSGELDAYRIENAY